MTLWWAAPLGAIVGAGVFVAIAALADQLPQPRAPRLPPVRRAHLGLIVVLAVVWIATQWVAAVVAVAVGWAVLPNLLVRQRALRQQAERSEAIARWTELLRDNLAAGAGLEQAIAVSARAAPAAIAPAVERLRVRLERVPLPVAVRGFGADLADPTADLVVAALVTATTKQTSQLVPLLGELARSTRDVARMRERVIAARASTWQAVRTITLTVLGFVGALTLLTRAWLTPYDTIVGQLALALVAGGFIAGLWWLQRLADAQSVPRPLVRESS